jgi:hypothetical protein
VITSEVQRTLVKSPPELWTELSDPDSLARHLGELGAIEIVRVEPEELVEWRTEDARGEVRIKASGWGTKVTLTVTKELPEQELPEQELPEPPRAGPEPPAQEAEEPSLDAQGEADISEPGPAEDSAESEVEPKVEAASEVEPELEACVEVETTVAVTAPEPESAPEPEPPAPSDSSAVAPERRGFFARLFGRRRRSVQLQEQPEGPDEPATEPVPSTPEADAAAPVTEPSPVEEPQAAVADPMEKADLEAEVALQEPEAEPTAEETSSASDDPAPTDMAAELKAAEEVAEAEVTAVLTAVLDRLGAAHHRPFSRA